MQPTIILMNGIPHAWHEGSFYPVVLGGGEVRPSAPDKGSEPTPEPKVQQPESRHGHGTKHLGAREASLAYRIRRYLLDHGSVGGVDRDEMIAYLIAESPTRTAKQIMQAAGQLNFKKEITIFPLGCRRKQTYLPTGLKKHAGGPVQSPRPRQPFVMPMAEAPASSDKRDRYVAPEMRRKRGAWGDHLRSVCTPNEEMDLLAIVKQYNDEHGIWGTVHQIKPLAHCKMLHDFIVDYDKMTIMFVPD